jgi:hypothetical protein
MTWNHRKGNIEEAILAGFHLRIDTSTGKGELQPGGWYASFYPESPGTTDEYRAAIIQAGYEKLSRLMTEYREAALEHGVVVHPPTFIA